MNTKKYALLVGINRYKGKVKPLKGSLRDVKLMKDYLTPLGFDIREKTGSAATRSAIIFEFRNHLIANAEKGALVLFYFAGHGSTEKVHKDILRCQGNRVNETLVCYDSRVEGKWDLADKELKWLIGEAAGRGAEVVVIVDACHSGSITRGVGQSRHEAASSDVRPLDSYLENSASCSKIPRHILLAACKKDQEAMEFEWVSEGDYIHGGLFTDSLISMLNSINEKPISYRNLMAKCSLWVHNNLKYQTPHLDAFGYFDTYKYFLNLDENSAGRAKYMLIKDDSKDQWSIDFGLNKGMPFDTEKPARFIVYEDDTHKRMLCYAVVTSVEPNCSIVKLEKPMPKGSYLAVPLAKATDPQAEVSISYLVTKENSKNEWRIDFGINKGMTFDPKEPSRFIIYEDEEFKEILCYARVQSVEPDYSIVQIEPLLLGAYPAMPLEIPTQKLSIYTNYPEEELLAKIKQLKGYNVFCFDNLVEWEYRDKKLSEFYLQVEDNGHYSLRYSDTDKLIYPKHDHKKTPRDLNNRIHLKDLLSVLQLIENWRRFSQVSLPIRFSKYHESGFFPLSFSVCNPDGQKKATFRQNEYQETTEITLDLPGEWEYIDNKKYGKLIRYQINSLNKEHKNLYLHLLYFSGDFQIDSSVIEDSEALDQEIILKKDVFANLKRELKQETDTFKLFVSTQPFENFFPDQKGLTSFENPERSRDDKDIVNKPLSDWFTQTLQVKVLRELGEIGSKDLPIANGKILFKGHSSFSAKVSLLSTAQSARSHRIDYYISDMARHWEVELLDFSSDGQRETLLEIHHINDKTVVNKQCKLNIIFDFQIAPDEEVVAVTIPADYSQDHWSLRDHIIGIVEQITGGKILLSIDEIPDNPPDGRFEPNKSLKISLLKMKKA